MKKFYSTLLILIFSPCLFALSGEQIITNAELYRDHPWKCNIWNARPENRDSDPDSNDLKYPFYGEGAAVYDSQGNCVPATGSYTGVAYAWGLRETKEVFNEKLGKTKTPYLAGNIYNTIIVIEKHGGMK